MNRRNRQYKMGQIFTLLFAGGLLFFNPLRAYENNNEELNQYFQSVVLVKSDAYGLDSSAKPWSKSSISTGLGTGVIISRNRILTNAHTIENSKFITVQMFNDSRTYKAKVQYVGADCDLAILQLEDESFFYNVVPLPFSDGMPLPGSDLLVLGYPSGSPSLTVEKGTVTKIERNRYSYSGLDFRKVIKINANVMPGNSGGPAIQKGEIVGITFQISKLNKGVAYLIPNEIVKHFLKDIEDGTYDGFPNLGFTFQSGSIDTAKSFYGIPKGLSGVFVNTVYPNSSFSEFLRERDFVYRIDDFSITNEGLLGEKSFLSIMDFVEEKYSADPVTLYYYRGGQNFRATARLIRSDSLDIYRDSSQDYMLRAGLVFQPIGKAFFSSDEGVMDSSIKYHFSYFIQDRLNRYTERDLVLSFVFEDPLLSKYQKYRFKILETINGYTPQDLEHLKRLWKNSKNESIVLKFRGVNLPIVLNPDTVDTLDVRVRKRYGNEPKP